MDYFDVQIETELGEMVSYYVAATDEAQAEDFATAAFENGEIECMGIQIVSIYAYRAWALALIVFAGIREQQALVRIPKGMQGIAIVMVTAALLSLAFMGFSGVDGGLRALFGLE